MMNNDAYVFLFIVLTTVASFAAAAWFTGVFKR
jgi:hypothetical protein